MSKRVATEEEIPEDVPQSHREKRRKKKDEGEGKGKGSDGPKEDGGDGGGVWIGNLAFHTTAQQLRDFFKECTGIITRVHLPTASKGRNKGFAYVDFSTQDGVEQALGRSEKLLTGRQVLIKRATDYTRKDRGRRVYVGNLPFEVSAQDVRSIMHEDPQVEVRIATFHDNPDKCRGFGFLEFSTVELAERVVTGPKKRLNGRLLDLTFAKNQDADADTAKTNVTDRDGIDSGRIGEKVKSSGKTKTKKADGKVEHQGHSDIDARTLESASHESESGSSVSGFSESKSESSGSSSFETSPSESSPSASESESSGSTSSESDSGSSSSVSLPRKGQPSAPAERERTTKKEERTATKNLAAARDGKNVLVAATGSVAAIKLPLIVSALLAHGLNVRVITTQHARHFIDELPSGVRCFTDKDEWVAWHQRGDPVLHIELRRWADALLVAPLSANALAKMSSGLCDDLLQCVLRAWDPRRPVLVAPAMNEYMYRHPATARHLALLAEMPWVRVLASVEKQLMCGDSGIGGMYEWSACVQRVVEALRHKLTDRET